MLSADQEENHPLLADYLRNQHSHRNGKGRERTLSGVSDTNSTTDVSSVVHWTSCDEFKRCSCAVLSFICMAIFVGAALVIFWFLWAWFVLWLDLPGILTPIVWLCGFAAPLCVFRLFTLCPHCTRGCCSKPLRPPTINAWKANHLWNERRRHVEAIANARDDLPRPIAEMISDYCYHSDLLITAHKNQLVGIYPDSAIIHTVGEFSQTITDVSIPEGNIRSVYVLVRREKEHMANSFRNSFGLDRNSVPLLAGQNQPGVLQSANNNPNSTDIGWSAFCRSIPGWLWDPLEYVDMMICEYDLAKGELKQCSSMFSFEQLSNTTMQQMKGIYYAPSYRLLCDDERQRMVVSRDGEFVIFDNRTLQIIHRRELIARPDNGDDREQFLHLREYKWTSSVLIPSTIVQRILNVVDTVEHTETASLYNPKDEYVLIPFGSHALFVGNVMTGWLRYLDFSHVQPISDTEIHHVEFSQDCHYLYLCLTQKLALMNTTTFQPLLVVSYTHLDYTWPCGIIRLPPEELQLMMMRRYYDKKKLKKQQKRRQQVQETQSRLNLTVNNESESENENSANERQKPSQDELRRQLESVCVLFASTKVFVDPRMFLYRFPANKCRVVTHRKSNAQQKWKKRELFDGTWLLDRYSQGGPGTGSPSGLTNSDASHGGWAYLSLKQRPWKYFDSLNPVNEIVVDKAMKEKTATTNVNSVNIHGQMNIVSARENDTGDIPTLNITIGETEEMSTEELLLADEHEKCEIEKNSSQNTGCDGERGENYNIQQPLAIVV